MKAKKLRALVAVLILCLCLSACGLRVAEPDGGSTTTTTRTTAAAREEDAVTAYPDEVAGFQTEKPEKGEQIAILHTDKGDIYVRLFPEAAPKAVSNFIALAEEGYYNGLTFHYVHQNFIIQSGDPTATGTGGESATGEPFEDEFDTKLLNLYGALAMASDGEDDNGSQFYINQKNADAFGARETYTPEYRESTAKAMYESALEQLTAEELADKYGIAGWEDFITETYVYDWIPEEVWEAYLKNGGNLHLDGAFRRSGGHTVFGQVFEGMDVVEEIANAVTDSNYKPLVDICIKSVEITTYQG